MNQHEREHGHSGGHGEVESNLGDKLAVVLDKYWPVLLITFGAAFLFAIPFHTGDSYFGKTIGHMRPEHRETNPGSPDVSSDSR